MMISYSSKHICQETVCGHMCVKTTRSVFCKLYLLDTARHEGAKDNKNPSGAIKGGEFPDLVAVFS